MNVVFYVSDLIDLHNDLFMHNDLEMLESSVFTGDKILRLDDIRLYN